jgi:hypothetical protein
LGCAPLAPEEAALRPVEAAGLERVDAGNAEDVATPEAARAEKARTPINADYRKRRMPEERKVELDVL